MHDALLVRISEALAQLNRHVEFLDERHRLLDVLHPRLEVLTRQELHDDVRRAFGLAKLVDRDDVPVLQTRDRFRFALEPLVGGRIDREVDEHHLDGDVALEFGIAPFVQQSHAAAADKIDDVVTPDHFRNLRHGVFAQCSVRTG